MERWFTVIDVHLAAFLELNGISAEMINQNGRIIFSFPASDDFFRLANEFNQNKLLQDFTVSLKQIKARMFSAKRLNTIGGGALARNETSQG